MENVEVFKVDGDICRAIEIISRAYKHPIIKQDSSLYDQSNIFQYKSNQGPNSIVMYT